MFLFALSAPVRSPQSMKDTTASQISKPIPNFTLDEPRADINQSNTLKIPITKTEQNKVPKTALQMCSYKKVFWKYAAYRRTPIPKYDLNKLRHMYIGRIIIGRIKVKRQKNDPTSLCSRKCSSRKLWN